MKPFIRDRTPIWIVAYAVYLYLSGLSLRRVSRALSFFIVRSHQSIWRWVHRFGGLSRAFHVGGARTAIVDERSIDVKGLEAWVWMAIEPRSRKLLAIELSWTRNILVAYRFLKYLRDSYGVRIVIVDGAPWYVEPSIKLGLRLNLERGGPHNIVERLSREVKRRLRDFNIYSPCRCREPLKHVETWLEAWRSYYNNVRYHMSLGKTPCGFRGLEPHTMLSIVEEVMKKA